MAKFIPNDEVKYEIPKPVFDIFPKINLEAKSTSSVFSEEIQKAENTNTEIKDEIQTRMDIFYNEFQKEENKGKSYLDITNYFKSINRYDIVIATMLGNMNFQIGNGGIEQWNDNGYVEDSFEDIYNFVKKAYVILPEAKKLRLWLREVLRLLKEQTQYDLDSMDNYRDQYEYERYDHEDSPMEQRGTELSSEYYNDIVEDINDPNNILDTMMRHYEEIMKVTDEQVKNSENNLDKEDEKPLLKPNETGIKFPQIKVKLVGTDGNIFALTAKVSNVLKQNRVNNDSVKEFSKDVMNSFNYDEALSKITNWVNVE